MRPAEHILAELAERELLELATRIAKEHHLTVAELVSGRGKDIIAMRQHFYFECLELGLAGVRVSRMFGVDTSSVTYGAKRWQRARVAAAHATRDGAAGNGASGALNGAAPVVAAGTIIGMSGVGPVLAVGGAR